MKNEKEIEEEFRNYQIKSDYVVNLDKLEAFISIGLDNLNMQEEDLKKEIKANNRMKLISELRNFFSSPFKTKIYATDLYTYDNEIINEMIDFIRKTKKKFLIVELISEEENVKELTKLLDFITDYYNEGIDYYDTLRQALESSCKGLNYENYKYQNNEEAIDEFFHKETENISEKAVEKSKRI